MFVVSTTLPIALANNYGSYLCIPHGNPRISLEKLLHDFLFTDQYFRALRLKQINWLERNKF